MIKLGVDNLGRESFNRTFMELKLGEVITTANTQSVLIVPLWNWNDRYGVVIRFNTGFNRTFMELK